MKRLILSIAMVTFIAGTVSVSFGQYVDKQSDKAQEPIKTEKNAVLVPQQESVVTQIDSIADFQNLTKASDVRFIENEKNIADLKLKNTTMDETKKTAKGKEIDLLEQKNNSLKKELVSYKKEGKTEWKSFKKQFNSDMDKLTDDLKNMKNVATL